jgi:hypothetical protein
MLGALLKTSPLAAGNPTIEATFRKMLDPRGWLGGLGEVDDVLGRKAQGLSTVTPLIRRPITRERETHHG